MIRSTHCPVIPVLWLAFLFAGLTPDAAQALREQTNRLEFQRVQSGDGDTDRDPLEAAEQPDDLQLWLGEIRELQVSGDLDGARTHLTSLTSSEVHDALLASAYNVTLPGLDAIDELAESLGHLQVQGIVAEQRVARLSILLEADHPALIAAKLNLATMRHALGDLAGALELFEVVHAKWERLLPPNHPDLLLAKQNLAGTRYSVGDLAGALELDEQVHAARALTLPADHPDLLAAKLNLAGTREVLGDLTGALELQEYVHEAWERSLPPEHPNLLTAKLNLALTRKALGDLSGALELEEFVVAMREKSLPAQHPDLLAAKLNLAWTRGVLGDLAGALELQEVVCAMRSRSLPPDHPELLAAQQSLAGTLKALGDLARALELDERVHAAWNRLLPPDHPDLLGAKQNLASTRRALGDLAGALELDEVVHAAWERLLPADHPNLLAAKMNLAATRDAMGDFVGALELDELVLATWEPLLAAEHPNLLTAKLNLAVTRFKLGDFAGALELQKLVHATRSRTLAADHPDLLETELNLASTLKALGNLEEALELEEWVHTVRAGLLLLDHPDLIAAKLNLASTRMAIGDRSGSLELVSAVLEGQCQRARALRRDAPRVARAAAAGELQRISTCLFLAGADDSSDAPGLEAELFSALENLRGVSVGAGAIGRTAAKRPELAGLLDSLQRAREAVSDQRLSPPPIVGRDRNQGIDSWRAELLRLAEERDVLEKRVRSALAEADFDSVSPTAKRVAAGLSAGAVLIDFLRYDRYGTLASDADQRPRTVDSLLALVLTADGTVTRVELGPSIELERMVTRWRSYIGKPIENEPGMLEDRGVGIVGDRVDGAAHSRGNEIELGTSLRELLIDPCLAAVETQTPSELHLILDDFLHLLAVDALPWRDGKRLGEAFAVHLEVSAQRLASGATEFSGNGVLLALGGADYGAQDAEVLPSPLPSASPPMEASSPSNRSSRMPSFSPLANTKPEVNALGRLFDDFSGGKSILLTGASATKKALFGHASSARYMHLATHGWFAPETFVSTMDSLEQRNKDLRGSLFRADNTVRGFAPETLCGLALAGANHGVNSAGKVPGIITAEELGALDLSGCELAVLSACETNVGLRRAGQGIQSLQMALHTAGARTTITSLWRVDDAATRRLMELFYTKLWKDKLGKADALWQAKMALRKEGYGLKDWAAWVLTGDPR